MSEPNGQLPSTADASADLLPDEILRTPPNEDVGAATHGRYRFQWEIGARTIIAMLTGDAVIAVVCEWHEDHVVEYADGVTELVSVKHREPSEGPWTLRGLCVDGGIAHLFERWLTLQRIPRCRVVTNAGLNGGAAGAAAFAVACHTRDDGAIRGFAVRIIGYLGAASEDDVVAFCKVLSVEDAVPGRSHIRSSNVHDLMIPALEQMGISTTDPGLAYEACVGLVEAASRDRSDRLTLSALGDVDRFAADRGLTSLIESRSISPSRARAAVMAAVTRASVSLAPAGTVPLQSVLVRKLARGGVGPTGIRSAQRLRAVWSEMEARYRGDLPGANAELEDLRTRVLAVVSAAENRVLSESAEAPYGRRMMDELRNSLSVAALGRVPAFPIENWHLEGLVYQLTDECDVWWSDEFPIEGAA